MIVLSIHTCSGGSNIKLCDLNLTECIVISLHCSNKITDIRSVRNMRLHTDTIDVTCFLDGSEVRDNGIAFFLLELIIIIIEKTRLCTTELFGVLIYRFSCLLKSIHKEVLTEGLVVQTISEIIRIRSRLNCLVDNVPCIDNICVSVFIHILDRVIDVACHTSLDHVLRC